MSILNININTDSIIFLFSYGKFIFIDFSFAMAKLNLQIFVDYIIFLSDYPFLKNFDRLKLFYEPVLMHITVLSCDSDNVSELKNDTISTINSTYRTLRSLTPNSYHNSRNRNASDSDHQCDEYNMYIEYFSTFIQSFAEFKKNIKCALIEKSFYKLLLISEKEYGTTIDFIIPFDHVTNHYKSAMLYKE